MIGKLRGKIDSIAEDKLILDVSGVGYNIYASSRTLAPLDLGQEISLIIETIVREDHIHLYGFSTQIEKTWFNELCKVKGVGNKVALKILGALSIEDIILAINSGDKTLFSKTPGIGPKLALRIVSELKDSTIKIGGDFIISGATPKIIEADENRQLMADAISALENLGYKRSDAYAAIAKKISENPAITLETLITAALRELSKR
jgi:Holliday junction DNA helicase RuvA